MLEKASFCHRTPARKQDEGKEIGARQIQTGSRVSQKQRMEKTRLNRPRSRIGLHISGFPEKGK